MNKYWVMLMTLLFVSASILTSGFISAVIDLCAFSVLIWWFVTRKNTSQ